MALLLRLVPFLLRFAFGAFFNSNEDARENTHHARQAGTQTDSHNTGNMQMHTDTHTFTVSVKVMRQAAAFQRSVKSFISVNKLHSHSGYTHIRYNTLLHIQNSLNAVILSLILSTWAIAHSIYTVFRCSETETLVHTDVIKY